MDLKPHKLATLFPEIQPDEFDQMVADIKRGGLLEPIWLYEGKVLDGWHRYRAARKAGIEPRTRTWHGKDPMAFVISMNIMRRHLNESQRAMLLVQAAEVAGTLVPQGGRDARRAGLVTPDADLAKQIHVGERTVTRARRILEKPELARKVIAGDLSLREADQRSRPRSHPSPGADWKQMREVKDVLEFIRVLREELPEIVRSARSGKMAPEAKRFLAAKVRPMASLLASFADWLER
jgi:hypothetical protein